MNALEKLPEVAVYYSIGNGLRDTLEGYYKNLRSTIRSPSRKNFGTSKTCLSMRQSICGSRWSRELPSERLLNSTVRLFHQMGRIFRDNAAPPSNPMDILVDSKRRKKLMQEQLAMGHKQDDHEQEQEYEQTIQ